MASEKMGDFEAPSETKADVEMGCESSQGSIHSSGQEPEPSPATILAPELTWRSGLATAGAATAYFCTVGFQNAFGIFQEYYTSTYLRTASNFQIAWFGTFCTFVIFACAPIAGPLTDKIGPTIPIIIGAVLQLIAVFMVSLCKEYYQFFLAQGLLLGIGMSFVAIPASGMVPRYFQRNRGLALGISVAGSSVGGVVWPIVFNQMLHHSNIGFPWAIRIAGFIMIPLLVFCVVSIQPPVKAAATVEEQQQAKEKKAKDLSALRKPPFLLICAGLFFGIFGFFVPLFYLSTYAVHEGMSASLGFYLISIVNGASMFGRILPGIVADRLGRFNLLTVSMFSASIIGFCWTAATSIPGLVIWTIAYGFFSGAILSLQIACATQLVDKDSAGAAIGAVMGSTSLATLFGGPIAGELLKHGYIALACFTGACLIVGGVFITGARMTQSRALFAKV